MMDALSLVGRGIRGHPHDHSYYHDILAESREDGHLPLALLDLIIHMACPCPRALSIKVLWARASIVAAFVGLISFTGHGSFQALLVILFLFSRDVWNWIGVILYVLCRCRPILREVQHVAFS